jgi:sterol desaturase/sphingolipid hydroxylase (fatty acid hydroxylase superfamily)
MYPAFIAIPALLSRILGWAVSNSLLPPESFDVMNWIGQKSTIIIFSIIALEILFPLKKRMFGKDTLLTGVYFLLAFKIAVFIVLVVPWMKVMFVKVGLPSLRVSRYLPLWAATAVSLVAASFVDYWTHRWLHTNRFLWHIHKIHHAPTHLNWATRYHQHFGMQILNAPLLVTTAYLVGGDRLAGVGLLLTVLDTLSHANISLKLGFLNYFFSTPEVHRYHHSSDPRYYNSNYGGVLMLWDQLFGTFHYDPEDPAKDFGLGQEAEPIPDGFLKQQIYPLYWILRDLKTTRPIKFLLRAARTPTYAAGD